MVASNQKQRAILTLEELVCEYIEKWTKPRKRSWKKDEQALTSEWEEFDLVKCWWTIPAHKSKNGNQHQVPLSKLAIELLQKIKSNSNNSKWLFPSPSSNSHFVPEAINKAVSRNKEKFKDIKHFTTHDLRRTAASNMTAIGIPRLVVSKILNHTENTVTAIYDRHSYDAEKKDALEKWGAQLKEIILKITG